MVYIFWLVVGGGGYILAGCGWWWEVGGGGHTLAGGKWWWVVVDIFWLMLRRGGSWWVGV